MVPFLGVRLGPGSSSDKKLHFTVGDSVFRSTWQFLIARVLDTDQEGFFKKEKISVGDQNQGKVLSPWRMRIFPGNSHGSPHRTDLKLLTLLHI